MNRPLWKSVAVIVVALFVVPGSGHASLKEKIQRKLDVKQTDNQNVQYQPYYLELNSPEMEGQDILSNQGKPQSNQEAQAPFPLSRGSEQQFRRCLPEEPQGSNFIVYNVSYSGTLEENVVMINGEVILEVFDHPDLKRAEIPLVSDQVGLIDVQVNRGKSFVMSRKGKYYLVIDKPGRYTLNIEYLLKAKREREGGPGSFHADIMPAPISQFEFVLPEEDVQVFIEPAIKVETSSKDGKTAAWAVMPNTNSAEVRWTKALPKTTIEKAELEPKIYAETSTFVSIGGGVVQAHSQIQYSILQAEVSTFRIALPEDVSVLGVNSNEMRDWKVSKQDNTQYLDVFLNFGTKGKHVIDIDFERNMDEGISVVGMPWVRPLNVERENGFYGIAASTNLEIKVGRSEKVTQIDTKQLPEIIWRQAGSPVLLAFKYLNHPFAIDIEMTRHEEIPVLVAAIDAAYPETLLTVDGKALTKLVFNVRNNVKQYLRIKLPETATVWSSFVNNEPVKPAKDNSGNILISLKKSDRGGGDATQFPVEIVYLDETKEIKGSGSLKLSLPEIDLPVNELDWRIYLPDHYIYFNMRSDGEILESRSPARMRDGSSFLAEVQQSSQNQVMDNQMISKGEFRDREWGQKTKGLLPIKVDLPRRGEAVRISKMLVVEGDKPWITVRHIPWGRAAVRWTRFFKIIIFIVVSLWVFRRLFFRRKKAGEPRA
ncbi:MAG: hypothetical protein AB1650_04765 [Candidatus Omnitrophota bacterium]